MMDLVVMVIRKEIPVGSWAGNHGNNNNVLDIISRGDCCQMLNVIFEMLKVCIYCGNYCGIFNPTPYVVMDYLMMY